MSHTFNHNTRPQSFKLNNLSPTYIGWAHEQTCRGSVKRKFAKALKQKRHRIEEKEFLETTLEQEKEQSLFCVICSCFVSSLPSSKVNENTYVICDVCMESL